MLVHDCMHKITLESAMEECVSCSWLVYQPPTIIFNLGTQLLEIHEDGDGETFKHLQKGSREKPSDTLPFWYLYLSKYVLAWFSG